MTFPLHVYRARWWSSVDWDYRSAEILAENEDQVRAAVDLDTRPQFRVRRPTGWRELPETQWPDTLTIETIQTIDRLPFVLVNPDS